MVEWNERKEYEKMQNDAAKWAAGIVSRVERKHLDPQSYQQQELARYTAKQYFDSVLGDGEANAYSRGHRFHVNLTGNTSCTVDNRDGVHSLTIEACDNENRLRLAVPRMQPDGTGVFNIEIQNSLGWLQAKLFSEQDTVRKMPIPLLYDQHFRGESVTGIPFPMELHVDWRYGVVQPNGVVSLTPGQDVHMIYRPGNNMNSEVSWFGVLTNGTDKAIDWKYPTYYTGKDQYLLTSLTQPVAVFEGEGPNKRIVYTTPGGNMREVPHCVNITSFLDSLITLFPQLAPPPAGLLDVVS